MPARKNRLNEIKQDKHGILMKIIKDINYDDIYVQFLDAYGAIVHTQYDSFKKGTVTNPYYPSVYGVGYLGQGKYDAIVNRKMTKSYSYWKAMIGRCYCEATKNHTSAYIDITVCKEWHNYQNFAKWFEDNYYEVETEQMCLDKDIIGKHKHIYSPETCIFVPKKINGVFVFGTSSYTKLPVGVYYDEVKDKYIAQCGSDSKTKRIGQSDSPHEAFLMYKKVKENKIKKLAQQYKSKIPKYIFDLLMSYEVDEYY